MTPKESKRARQRAARKRRKEHPLKPWPVLRSSVEAVVDNGGPAFLRENGFRSREEAIETMVKDPLIRLEFAKTWNTEIRKARRERKAGNH